MSRAKEHLCVSEGDNNERQIPKSSFHQGQTDAIMIDNFWGAIDDVCISSNYLTGGDFTVYLDESSSGVSGTPGRVTNIVFTNNVLGIGTYDYVDIRSQLGDQPFISCNVDALTGASIQQNNGACRGPLPSAAPTPQ